jgi:hypothetical protein
MQAVSPSGCLPLVWSRCGLGVVSAIAVFTATVLHHRGCDYTTEDGGA